jgi:hypothetical protein
MIPNPGTAQGVNPLAGGHPTVNVDSIQQPIIGMSARQHLPTPYEFNVADDGDWSPQPSEQRPTSNDHGGDGSTDLGTGRQIPHDHHIDGETASGLPLLRRTHRSVQVPTSNEGLTPCADHGSYLKIGHAERRSFNTVN